MNLTTYQKFLNAYLLIYKDNKEQKVDIPTYLNLDKSEFLKKSNMTAKEYEKYKDRRTRLLEWHVETCLPAAKVFEMDNTIKRLLLLTDKPKDKKLMDKLKLPFASIFFDVEFDKSELGPEILMDKITGILVSKHYSYLDNDDKVTMPMGDMTGTKFEYFYVVYCGHKDDYFFIEDCIFPLHEKDLELNMHYYENSGTEFLRSFVINFLTFIQHPEIDYIKTSRSNKNKLRRIKEGKLPLPSSDKIILKGRLKRYASNFSQNLNSIQMDYKVWVRGHWRCFRNARYKNALGKVIWIAPFIKGKGELINKVYNCKADKIDKKELSNQFIFFDDIEPAKKPLKEVR